MSQAPTLSPIEEVVTFLAGSPSREEIAAFRLSESSQERLRELLARNAAGNLTREETRELDQMVLLDDILSLLRVRAQRDASPPQGVQRPHVSDTSTGSGT